MIHRLRRNHRITDLLCAAEMPRSTYYYHVKQFDKADKYAEVKRQIHQLFAENKGRLGYRRITSLLRQQGSIINHKTVHRLMKTMGLFCQVRKKKNAPYRGQESAAVPNLLNRQFVAQKPNEKWVTDVTEFHLFGEKLYLSAILDLYNQEIVTYSFSRKRDFPFIIHMLEQAFVRLPDKARPMLHSDQGWQYHMKPYQAMLKANGIQQSMSRKGNCYDNAIMENFFGHLKCELLYLEKFDSMNHLQKQITEYIHYYNHHRIKEKLGAMAPVPYRINTQQIA